MFEITHPTTYIWTPKWKNGDWRYDFRILGNRLRGCLGLRDATAQELATYLVKQKYDQFLTGITNPQPTFAEAALHYMKATGVTRFIATLIEHFGPKVRIDQINQNEIQRACAAWAKQRRHVLGYDVKPETIRRNVEAPLNAVLNHAKGQRRKPRTKNVRRFVLSPEQAEHLFTAADHPEILGIRDPERRLKKLIAFLLGTGCTTGEAFAVDVDDINFATWEVLIRGVEKGAGKTAFRTRLVRIPRKAMLLIGELPKSGKAFLRPDGKPYILRKNGGGQIKGQFRKLCDAAGISKEMVPHSLRHTWATNFSAQVGDHDQLLDRGGWAKSETARDYRKLTFSDLAQRLFDHGWDYRAIRRRDDVSNEDNTCP